MSQARGLLLLFLPLVYAVVPNAEVGIGDVQILVAQAVFGGTIPLSSSKPLDLTVLRPTGYQDGCEPVVRVPSHVETGGFALLVQRSPNCTFGDRAVAAQSIGAKALIVANSIEGIYRNRSYGEALEDYDCSNGEGYVPSGKSEGGKLNGFPLSSCAADERCASKRCLLTGEGPTSSSSGLHVCCAWDSYITMSTMSSSAPITVPSVFVTMVGADSLAAAAPVLFASSSSSAAPGSVSMSLALRWRPFVNLSSVLMWALGCLTAFYASWLSCEDVRRAWRDKHGRANNQQRTGAGVGRDDTFRSDEDAAENEQPALELTGALSVGFIATASGVLVLLFYVDLYLVVTVLFCVSASSSVGSVLFRPAVGKLLGASKAKRVLANSELCGPVTALDAASNGLGALLALAWFLTRFTWPWAFLLQDLFGCCLCALFLGVIRLPNLRVATTLLSLAFVYDVFFVFLSPLFFHESVMVKVATGNQPTADPNLCEKYPSAAGCRTEELPMLLLLPRIQDFSGGFTMLGLGDIVLPGLLLSFGCRFDCTSKHCLSVKRWPEHWLLLCAGYAAGLACANFAVALTNLGQPALLYLVPCTLGPLLLKAQREGTLKELWEGPPEMALFDGGGGGGIADRESSVGDRDRKVGISDFDLKSENAYHHAASRRGEGSAHNHSSTAMYGGVAVPVHLQKGGQEGEPLLFDI